MRRARKAASAPPMTDVARSEAMAVWAAHRGVKLTVRALETLAEFRARIIAALAKEASYDREKS